MAKFTWAFAYPSDVTLVTRLLDVDVTNVLDQWTDDETMNDHNHKRQPHPFKCTQCSGDNLKGHVDSCQLLQLSLWTLSDSTAFLGDAECTGAWHFITDQATSLSRQRRTILICLCKVDQCRVPRPSAQGPGLSSPGHTLPVPGESSPGTSSPKPKDLWHFITVAVQPPKAKIEAPGLTLCPGGKSELARHLSLCNTWGETQLSDFLKYI